MYVVPALSLVLLLCHCQQVSIYGRTAGPNALNDAMSEYRSEDFVNNFAIQDGGARFSFDINFVIRL